MSNESLEALITTGEQKFSKCGSRDDLLKCIDDFRSYPGELTFNHKKTTIWCILLTVVCIPSSVIGIARAQNLGLTPFDVLTYGSLAVAMITLISFITLICQACSQANRIPHLSKRMLFWSASTDHGITGFGGDWDSKMSTLKNTYGDFDRGFQRELTYGVKGVFPGDLHDLAYEYFAWKYTVKTYVPQVDSKGKVTMVEKNTDYNRYCLIIDFPWVKNVVVRGDGSSSFSLPRRVNTASSQFNSCFDVSGSDAITAAKFLKPTTINHLLEMARIYGSANLEFSSNGKLCFSFTNSNMMDTTFQGMTLLEPDKFHDAIVTGIRLEHLFYALHMIHRLAEQHDDNFSDGIRQAS